MNSNITAASISYELAVNEYVKLPPIEIVLDEPIRIVGKCVLEGSGHETRLNATGNFPAITMADADEKPSDVLVKSLRITRTNTLGATEAQDESDGIRVWGDRVTVEDVWIDDCWQGVNCASGLDSTSSKLRLNRCSITHADPDEFSSFTGIHLADVDGVIIEGCQPGASYVPWLYPDSGTRNFYGVARVFKFVPVAASTTRTHAAFAGDDASNTFPGPIVQPDVPRVLSVTFGASWDGGSVRVDGTDVFGQPEVEFFSADPGNTVTGEVVFATVTSISKTAVGADSDTASVGIGNEIGIPAIPTEANGVLLVDNTPEDVSVEIDAYSFIPTTNPNGSHVYQLLCNVLEGVTAVYNEPEV